MNVEHVIEQYRSKVNRALKVFLDKSCRRMHKADPFALELMQHAAEFCLRGGKRLRPILVVFGYKACGGRKEAEILNVSVAVELMESYLLIHDDIMDQDELRRGYLTMHKVFEGKCKGAGAARYGESMAIILGDLLAVLGSQAILDSRFQTKRKLLAAEIFNRAVVNTCIGQALDITMNMRGSVSERDVAKLYGFKTSVYTVDAPLQIGAVLAGAGPKTAKILHRYSITLGRAFQYQDDILGMFGTRHRIGKPVGSDLREGKRTLLIVKALELAGKKDRDTILGCLGRKDLAHSDIERVRRIVEKTGALDYTKNEAARLALQSSRVIARSSLMEPARTFLQSLAHYMVRRQA